MLSLYLILLAIAGLGILALTLIALSYRKPAHKKLLSAHLTESDESDDVALDDVATISTKPFDDTTLASMGFSALDTVADEQEIISNATTTTSFSHIQPEYHPEKKISQTKNIIVLYLLASSNHLFSGYELQQALIAINLRFGEKRIFHRYEEDNGEGQILFSVASATEPGIFDVANIGGFSCSGLCIFMSPDKVNNAAATFELMLETARQLAEDLGGIVCNEDREPLTDEEISEFRTTL